ncbi:flagellar export chaperone FliS [[Clostridium] colinum]|uniref:flagellar export chaperone FliS n=1 Tax=[Clostridium] colinum TaxID=36835 RepID=UPI002023D282|nr:flagellar export chaperone FliS [[Clostridium] colinum]
MYNNPYAKIKENSINTATPEELTLMLYNGAVKFANQAIVAIEKKDFFAANKALQRTKDIVRELQLTLNMDYDISHELYAAYDYMHRRLTQANMKKDIDIVNEILEYLRLFRDTWKEAMKIARASKS